MQNDIKGSLRQFINRQFLFDDAAKAFTDDDSFLEKGIVDSTGVLELLSFVEHTWKIRVEDAEMLPENLDSLSRLADFVRRKTAR